MKDRITVLFPGWEDKIKEEYGIDSDHLHLIVDENFHFINDAMANPTMPTITIPKFGSLTPRLGAIRSGIALARRWYLQGKEAGGASRVKYAAYLRKIWPIKNRLINELNGEWTAKNWARHFKDSVGSDKIVYREDCPRYWLQDIPAYKKMIKHTKDKPEYTKNIKPNTNKKLN